MVPTKQARIRRYQMRGAWAAGIVLLSVSVTVLMTRVLSPQQAVAQPGQPAEVRASAFVLVGQDGSVLARLAPSGDTGNGQLTLFDTAGKTRLFLHSSALAVLDRDGTTVRTAIGLDRQGDGAGAFVNDSQGKMRVAIGTPDGGFYGVAVQDASGQPVATLP